MVRLLPVKEFREFGYLQELNRLFLHPLGLALATSTDLKTGEERIVGIADRRDDDEGWMFEDEYLASDVAREKFLRVRQELERRAVARERVCPGGVQKIPHWDAPAGAAS